jgi:hypothetical protein
MHKQPDDSGEGKMKKAGSVIFLLGSGILIGVIIMFLFQNREVDFLNCEFGSQSFKLNIKATDKIQIENLLDSIWKKEFNKNGLKGWLMQKNIYEFGADMMRCFDTLSPKHILSQHLIDLVGKYKGPFKIEADSVFLSVPEYAVPDSAIYCCKGNSNARKMVLIESYNRTQNKNLMCIDKMGACAGNSNCYHISKNNFELLVKKHADGTYGTAWLTLQKNL